VGETSAKAIDPEDRSTVTLFGDGGSATLLEQSENGRISFLLGGDGSGHKDLIHHSSAFRKSHEPRFLNMNGMGIMSFVVEAFPKAIQLLLSQNASSINEVDFFVFHQANKMILDYLAKRIVISQDQMINNLRDFGNTGSSSIPLALCVNANKFSESKKLCLGGFGAGLSWGVCLADLSKTKLHNLVYL
jgi:3-oxoacyl-[acyl-carrier-protein] synthase-3